MSPQPDARKARMAEAVRQIVTRRERAPRSPRLERAYKRLIWRYTRDPEGGRPGVPGWPEEGSGSPGPEAERK